MQYHYLVKKYQYDLGIHNKIFIVQGFGNVEYWASRFLVDNGSKLIGVVEFNNAVYCPEGLNQYFSWIS